MFQATRPVSIRTFVIPAPFHRLTVQNSSQHTSHHIVFSRVSTNAYVSSFLALTDIDISQVTPGLAHHRDA